MTNQPPLLCEHCGYPFDPKRTVKGPVICPACGLTAHPYGTAQKVAAPSCTRTGRWLLAFVLVLMFGLLLVNTVGLYQTRKAQSALIESVTVLSDLVLQNNIIQTEENRVISDTAALVAEAQAIQETALRNTPQESLSEQDRQIYNSYAAKLDERYPPCATNDFVKLRQINGLILRGQFIGLKDDTLLLLQNGTIQTILLPQLDRDSRLRVDPVFREKAIQFQMNKASTNQGDQQPPASSGRES